MKAFRLISFFLFALLVMAGCNGKPTPPKAKLVNFLTLDDLNGSTRLQEMGPDDKIIIAKAKALIKNNSIRDAREKASAIAAKKALDTLVGELLTPAQYNENYEKIEQYLASNHAKYIKNEDVFAEKKIFEGRFYGIAAAYRLDRQKVLVALQKDLRVVDTSYNTLVTVITSRKKDALGKIGMTLRDVESSFMNQAQTDLNQRGLRAMDFRNALTSFNLNPDKKREYLKLSEEQFMDMVNLAGEQKRMQAMVGSSEKFYSTGLTLLKQMAKVVVEINIMNVSKQDDEVSMSLSVTAKNISSPTGGAFANTTIQVAARGGNPAAMITRLITDAYQKMQREFIPQVIKEMSIISVGGDKLLPYELVFQGFDSREARRLRGLIKGIESNRLVYVNYDNSLADVEPSINRVMVRYQGKAGELSDLVLTEMDASGLLAKEPRITPTTTDLVFVAEAKED